MKKLLLLLFLIPMFIEPVSAQDQLQGTNIRDVIDLPGFNDIQTTGKALEIIRAKSQQFNSIDPAFEIWERLSFEDDFMNFGLPGYFIVGDVNGDGYVDLVQIGLAPDERDNDLASQAFKTALTYGGPSFDGTYDVAFYELLEPLGDLNNDGFDDLLSTDIEGDYKLYQGSASGLNEVPGASASATLLGDLSFDSESFIVGEDVNGDGIDDIYGIGPDGSFYEIYGGSTLEQVQVVTTEFMSENTISSPIGVLQTDSATYYVMDDFGLVNESTPSISVYVKEGGMMVLSTVVPIEGQSRYFDGFLGDFNGDDVADLAVNNGAALVIIPGAADSDTLFDSSIGSQLTIEYQSAGFFSPDQAGELDNTTGEEFVFRSGKSLALSSGVLNDTTGTIESFSVATIIDLPSEYTFSSPPAIGALTGSEVMLAAVTARNNVNVVDRFGLLEMPYTITAEGVTASAGTAHLLNLNGYRQTEIRQMWPLHDLEGDGVDNFAVEIFTSDGFQQTYIYNGFSGDAPVRIPYPVGDTLLVQEVYSGYFNSTESPNVAVLFRDFDNNATSNDTQLWIYNNGDYQTAGHIIERNNLDVEGAVSNVSSSQNVGDLDGDGFDDLAIGLPSGTARGRMYMFKGGTSIADSPDQIIDYSSYGVGGFGVGTTLEGLGDVNGDGLDDFVVGDFGRAVFNGSINGALYVHNGASDFFDRETPITSADSELLPDISEPTNRQSFFGFNEVGVGDFDGDGSTDIVAKAFFHSTGTLDEGVGALSFFFNKDGFSAHPDTLIPIRMEYLNADPEIYSNTYQTGSGRSLIQGVGDLDGDGDDELLYVSGGGFSNGIVYGGGDLAENNVAVLNSPVSFPNSNLGSINPSGNFINLQYVSAVGDYNGDGSLVFATYQRDPNFKDQPIYGYQLTGITVNNEQDRLSTTPEVFSLEQNYPNPFNPTTSIQFNLPVNSTVNLTVHNLLGQQVASLVDGMMTAGSHSVNFDASQLSSGMYFYRLQAGSNVMTRKMMLIK